MSRNPILTDKAFEGAATSPADEWQNAQQMGAGASATGAGIDATMGARSMPAPATDGKVMTLGGVASATALMFAVLVAAAAWGWSLVSVTQLPPNPLDPGAPAVSIDAPYGILIVASIAALVLAMVTAFRPASARFTSLLYAACKGVVLGMISRMFDAQWNGIVVQAVLATLGVFLVMLALFGLRVLRATPRFTKGVIAATLGVAIIYFVGFIASLFGLNLGFWGTSGSTIGIVVSVVVCIIAAMNLILDFEFIEQGTKRGLPAYMDWYAGFG
ncbi:MAG: Bax inhibitor-1/YccA family protein, partial [Actinomycetes bacterium]